MPATEGPFCGWGCCFVILTLFPICFGNEWLKGEAINNRVYSGTIHHLKSNSNYQPYKDFMCRCFKLNIKSVRDNFGDYVLVEKVTRN